jgi:hypothetical protein
MSNNDPNLTFLEVGGPQFQDFFKKIQELLTTYIRHGHFEITVTCQIGKNGRREVYVSAGKCSRYIIPSDELPR